MNKKCAQPGVAERGPVYSVENRKLSERLRKPLALAGTIGALALAGAAGSANRTASLEGAGFADPDIVWNLPDAAAIAVERDMQAGATDLEATFPITFNVPRIADEDMKQICMTAQLAGSKDFELLERVDLRGEDRNFGKVPRSPTELANFESALEDFVTRLVGPDGCAKNLKKLDLATTNELDNELFNEGQRPSNRYWSAPADGVRINTYVYPRLHAKATELGFDGLKIGGGELDQNDADIFLNKTAAYMRLHKITQKQMDFFAEHFYVQRARPDSQAIAYRNILRIMGKVHATYGADMPLWYTEVGAISMLPANEAEGYVPLPKTVVPMTAEAQGRFYTDFLRAAACLGVAKVFLWHAVDDGSAMRTGLFYLSKRPKLSYSRVAPVMKQVTSGQLAC